MNDQLLDDLRRSSESLLAMQQDFLRRSQLLFFKQLGLGERSESERSLQKRSREFVVTMLNKHREFVDSTYRSSNQLFERALCATETNSPDEYRHIVDDLQRELLATVRERSESQVREFCNMADEAFEYTRKAAPL